MRPLRFFTFVLFNFFYRDGNNDRTEPYTPTLMTILFLEFLTVLIGIEFLSLFFDFDIFKMLVSLCGGTRVFGVALLLLFGTPSYYFFIKKKGFDRYYSKFKDDPINTKRNRKIGYICLIAYLPIWIILMVLFRTYSH